MKIFKICIEFLNKKNFKKLISFSMIELMIAFVTISCIIAAFAPVITKKINKKEVAIQAANQVFSNCERFNGDNCQACYPDKCIVCTLICQPNYFLNVDKCICEACATNCAECPEAGAGKCDICEAEYYLTSSKTCAKCQTTYNGKKVCCPKGSTNQTTACEEYDSGG